MDPNLTDTHEGLCLLLYSAAFIDHEGPAEEPSFTTTGVYTTRTHIENSSVTNVSTYNDDFIDFDSVSITESIKDVFTGIINPAFCICGILGNFINVIVLTRPRMQVAMDCSLEKSAQTGLISLAVSDMLYCMTSIIRAFMGRSQVVFHQRDIWLFIQLYGSYIQNIFANTSTWLTVILAAGRYAAICKPLHARHLVGVNPTRVAVCLTFFLWVLLQLPSAWTYTVVVIPCSIQTFYMLDHGPFVQNNHLKLTFAYLWATVGFLFPVVILAYCNVHLIRALRESRRMRKLYVYRVNPKTGSYGNRVTPTLIAIVFMSLVLVTPSEILQFFHYHISEDKVEAFNILLVVANTLQTINFAMNFVLYCVVNVQFRETLKGVIFCLVRRNTYYRWRQRRSRASSNSTKGSIMIHSNFDSFISGSSTFHKEGSKSGFSL